MAGDSRYQVFEVLGRGGMGSVHRALQRDLQRVVALKRLVLGGESNEEYLARFRHEAQGMCRVSHPNLVRVFDAGELEGAPFIAMELVAGETLEVMVQKRPTDVRRRADALFHQIVSAVAALHEAGLVHRDLKSSNVMVDPAGRAVVMDLGLVKDVSGDGTRLTGTGALIGTPRYIAPEVLAGEPARFAADVWALGCLYFELHAGRYLFDEKALGPLMRTITCYEIPDVAACCPELPAERRALLAHLIARDPEARPAHATAVKKLLEDPAALARLARPATVALPVTSPPLRTRVWRWAALAGALGVLPALAFVLARRSEPLAPPSPAVRSSASAPVANPRVAALVTSIEAAARERDVAPMGAELVDALIDAEPAQRPRLRGAALAAALFHVTTFSGELKRAARYGGIIAGVNREARAESIRRFRRGVDAALVVIECADPVDAIDAQAYLSIAAGFLLDPEYAAMDPATAKRLLTRLQALVDDPVWDVTALSAIAHERHHESDHAGEHARRFAALERFEARHLRAPVDLGARAVDVWYQLLTGALACQGEGRAVRIARVREVHDRGKARIRAVGTAPASRARFESLLGEAGR